ncbi:MAG TPA: 3-isopropylmalate dehydratase small subunit [Candidatus Binataceae bacterium]|jgi:3-isopropylmalate/(R)-2-methylmalate dehydratase small subunit|nr:3-isopropylmalate dehydratase small subunit [Candidatus Binataceae bacterium]
MIKPLKNFTGLVAPLDRPNVDTDQIIPKQFLKAVVRSGLAQGLFYDWRNQPDSQFVLNQPRFEKSTILVARANFGCGSSREHAVWALADFGFKAVIAPSFADIFKNNCLKNGILTIILKPAETDAIFEAIKLHQDYRLAVDLPAQTVSDDFGWRAHFEIDAFPKRCLLEGLDDIALTLMQDEKIKAHETAHPVPYKF